MQVDQGSRQPWDRRKIADGREGYSGFTTGVGLQPFVGLGVDQTGFPGDMIENARHGAILAISQGKHTASQGKHTASQEKHTACSPSKDVCFVLSVCESNGQHAFLWHIEGASG